MRTIKQKRAEFMKTLTTFFDTVDPSGDNTKKYQEDFGRMSDEAFDAWMRTFEKEKKRQLYWEIEEFERDMNLDNIQKAADFLGIPLYEYVASPSHTGDPDNVVVTPTKVPVGYIHDKRMQQTLVKKNAGSIETSQRNPTTGQVINEDKNARISDAETYSLIAIDANDTLKEFMGPRADDMVASKQMVNNISRDGYVSLKDLDNEPQNKVALNTLDVYFTLQGFRTNLVAPMITIPGPKIKGSRM